VSQIDNVVYLHELQPDERSLSGVSDLPSGAADVMATLGHLVKQIEKWPMDERAKEKMLISAKSLALQACALQLAAVDDRLDFETYRAEVDRIIGSVGIPEA
jgi:hypothetical protein